MPARKAHIKAQKSEVHETTADASGSPTSPGDRQTTRATTGGGPAPAGPTTQPTADTVPGAAQAATPGPTATAGAEPVPVRGAPDSGARRDPHPPHAWIVRDDTDDGGPLAIDSDDPDLNPPHVPADPFPTDRTPEIDPPVEKEPHQR